MRPAWQEAFAAFGLEVDDEILRRRQGGDLNVKAVAGEQLEQRHGEASRSGMAPTRAASPRSDRYTASANSSTGSASWRSARCSRPRPIPMRLQQVSGSSALGPRIS